MIKKRTFSIDIEADKPTIWKALWEDAHYRAWAGVFFEGSYVVADNWHKGSKVHFLAPDQSGIYSLIEQHIPNEIIWFKHIGKVVNGKEQPLDEEAKKWTGTTEVYKLTKRDGFISLEVEIGIMEEHLVFMTKTFPQAMEVIRSNSQKLLSN
jgi:hypothetical protein